MDFGVDESERLVKPRLLSPEEVAAELGIATKTLANWRAKRVGPPVMRFRGVVRYPAKLFAKWQDEQIEEMNGTQTPQRKMALSIRSRRPRMDGKHRFGRHRTQRDRREEKRTRSEETEK
jgi:hypothetical protein